MRIKSTIFYLLSFYQILVVQIYFESDPFEVQKDAFLSEQWLKLFIILIKFCWVIEGQRPNFLIVCQVFGHAFLHSSLSQTKSHHFLNLLLVLFSIWINEQIITWNTNSQTFATWELRQYFPVLLDEANFSKPLTILDIIENDSDVIPFFRSKNFLLNVVKHAVDHVVCKFGNFRRL